MHPVEVVVSKEVSTGTASSSRNDAKIKRRCMAALGETLFYISAGGHRGLDCACGDSEVVVRCTDDSDGRAPLRSQNY